MTLEGDRDVLGMWFQETEGAKFWMQVLTDLKTRGVSDILICCVDGLKGFPEAIEAIFPKTTVQTCIVHLIRSSLQLRAPPRARAGRPRPQTDLHRRWTPTRPRPSSRRFDEKWGQRFPVITQAWLDAWEHVIPFLAFPEEVRRVIYTTDESVKVPAQFSWPWSCRSPVLVAEVGSCEVSLAGRDAGETRSGWGVGRVRACVILAPQDAVGHRGVLGLGFAQGVVDPRAKRRFWD